MDQGSPGRAGRSDRPELFRRPAADASHSATDQVVGRLEGQPVRIGLARRCRCDAQSRRLLVPEHDGEGVAELLAGRSVGHGQGMARHFPRVQHVHVDVDVDDVRELREALHLMVEVLRPVPEVLHRDHLDIGAVDQVLLQGIGIAHGSHHDVARGQGRLETRLEAQVGQAHAGRNRHRHAAQHAGERCLRRVEIAVSVDEDQPHLERTAGRSRVLQAAEHAHQGAAVGQQTDGEEALLAVGGDDVGEMAVGQAEAVPFAVVALLLRGELDRHCRLQAAAFLLEQGFQAS